MALFGFGSSKSQSRSSQVGFGQSESASFSRGVSGSESTQEIAFEDVFGQLFGAATGAAGRAVSNAPALTRAANQLFSSGTGFLDMLEGGAGRAALEERISGSSDITQERINLLQEDVGRLFREELNPAITSEAVAGGALGGGRQGVAQGLATEAAAREFQRGATTIRGEERAARDAAAVALIESDITAAATGLSGIEQLFGLEQQAAMAELAPLAQLASILGGPTVLTEQQARSEDIAGSASSAFDFSRGSSTSSSRSFDIGLF